MLLVSRAFTFKQQCRRSDQLLRRILEEQKLKTIERDLTHTIRQIQGIDDAANVSFQSNLSETVLLNVSECVLRESETEHSNEEFLTEVLIDESTAGDGVIDDTDANDITPYIDLDVANDISLDENTEESFGMEYLQYLIRGIMRIEYTYFDKILLQKTIRSLETIQVRTIS